MGERIKREKKEGYRIIWGDLSRRVSKALRHEIPKEEPGKWKMDG